MPAPYKRPRVGAAPAEIIAPISLRRVRPGDAVPPVTPVRGPPLSAPKGPAAVEGRARMAPAKVEAAAVGRAVRETERAKVVKRDSTQGGTEVGSSRTGGGATPKQKQPPQSQPKQPKTERKPPTPPVQLANPAPPSPVPVAQPAAAPAPNHPQLGEQGAAGHGGGRGRGRGRGEPRWYTGPLTGRGKGKKRHIGGGGGKRGPEKLLCLADLASWILVDNRTVPLYACKAAGPMKMMLGSEKTPDLLCEVVVDGVVCSADAQIIRAWRDPKQWTEDEAVSQRAFTWRGRSESATSLRPFVFSSLSLTPDADSATLFTESGLKALGTIELRVYRGRVGDASQKDWGSGEGEIGGKSVWEESKKVRMGVAHQADLGPARLHSHSARSTFQSDPEEWDSADKPWVVFGFKYRDRVTLEIEGHIQAEDELALPAVRPHRNNSSASASSSRSNSRDAASVKPKTRDRTDSPAMLHPRSPSASSPTAPPEAPGKGRGKGKGKASEKAGEVDEKPKPKNSSRAREKQPAPLGSITLRSSTSPSPPPPPLAKPSSSSGPKLLPLPKPEKNEPEGDVDAELDRLRAEIAEYKKRELERLRGERDEARRREEVREVLANRGKGEGKGMEKGKGEGKEKEEREEMVLEDSEEEEKEVAEVLLKERTPMEKKEKEKQKQKERPGMGVKRPSESGLEKGDVEEKEAKKVKREKDAEDEVLVLSDSDEE
ncbi:hypothetical protein JCM11251_002582 [Rhodosporidiobolus azoricus]